MPSSNGHLTKQQLSAEWCSAHRKLLENVRQQPFVSEYACSVHASLDGRKAYLPAYVPYIGPRYFEYRPRILCYAINQNLSPHVPWTNEWVTRWARDIDDAQDRLNRAAYEDRPIPIRPYAEGFIPLVALLAAKQWIEIRGGHLPERIEDIVAVTNFIKFSTAKDASSSSIPNTWWRECGALYVKAEIQTLQPDIILGFGQKTTVELRRVLKTNGVFGHKIQLLGCRFPARIPSIKGRPLSSTESRMWSRDILPLISKMRKPQKNSYHKWKIQSFPGYFIDVIVSWGRST